MVAVFAMHASEFALSFSALAGGARADEVEFADAGGSKEGNECAGYASSNGSPMYASSGQRGKDMSKFECSVENEARKIEGCSDDIVNSVNKNSSEESLIRSTQKPKLVVQKRVYPAMTHAHSHGSASFAMAGNSTGDAKARLSTYLLEICVAMHSVTVGLVVGMAPKSETLVLAIAVSFHQLFEGFAIGDRLARLCRPNADDHDLNVPAKTMPKYSPKFRDMDHCQLPPPSPKISPSVADKRKMYLGAVVYMFATPIGQLIGIILHSTIPPRSPAYLITLGSLEAASAGTLVYVAIVTLMTEEFNSPQFVNSSSSFKIFGFLSMYFGALVMAVIGKWA
ncbi:Fe(2+) transport protein 2 [Smittium culicis]|uniref:Fe(2+) transport protein 2 n=1 Tax=Smittium culicis TaxID=133412 RepID=A0A1R1YBK5_9FUNG|nr:Fe(2+) transport protein 2 [Smittium culicis]